MARALKKVVAWLGRGLLALLLLFGSVLLHLQHPVARHVARDALNQFASAQMRGRLAVGRIDQLELYRVVARHVAVFDAQGRRVIMANRVALSADLLSVFTGRLRIRSASLRGATVHLIDDGHGTPTLLGTFDPKTPSTNTSGAPGLRVAVERVRLARVTAYGDLLGLHGLRATDLSARGRLDLGESVEVHLRHAHATMTEPFGFTAQIDHLGGTISTRPERGIALQITARRGGELAHSQLRYRTEPGETSQTLQLALELHAVSPDTLRGLGYTWIGPIETPVSGRVHLHGPVDELSLDAALQTRAGAVLASGLLSSTHGVSVHLTSDSLAPARLVSRAPDVVVAGSADVQLMPSASAPHVRLQLAALQYKGIRVPAFDLEGIIDDTGLRIESVRAKQAGAQLSARGSLSFDGSAALEVDAHYPAIQRDPNLSRYVADIQGELTAHLRIRVPKDHPDRLDISGRVTITHLRYGSVVASKVTLEGSARGDPQLPTLKLDVSAADVAVLAYGLGAAHFGLHGGPKGYAAEGEFQAKGQRTFYFNATVAADRHGFVVQADPIEFAVGDNTWRGVARDIAVVHDQSVSLGLLRLASRSQRLEAKATIRLHGADEIDAQLQNFDLAALHALLGHDFPLSEGHIDATVQLRGDVERPALSLQGAVRDARVGEVTQVGAVYVVTYKDGQLDFDSEIDLADGGSLHLTGQGLLDARQPDPALALRDGRYTLDLNSNDFDLRLVPSLRSQLLSARLSGALHGEGTLEAPSVSGKLKLRDLQIGDTEAMQLSGDVDYRADALALDLKLSDRRGALGGARVKLALPWNIVRNNPGAIAQTLRAGDWQLEGESVARRVDELPFHLPAQWYLPIVLETHFDLQRKAGPVEGLVRWTAKTPSGFDYAECKLHVEPELRGVLLVQNGETRFSFTGHLGDQRVGSGKGRVVWPIDSWLQDTATAPPTRVDAEGDLDFAALQQIPVLCERGKGTLHAQWSVSGLLTETPSAILKTQVSFLPHVQTREGRHKLVVDSCGTDPMKLELEASADAQQITAQADMSGCRGGTTQLDGFAPITWQKQELLPNWDDQRDLRVQLDFDNAQLQPLLDRVPGVLGFSAVALGQLVVRGKHDRVHYHGNVQLHDGKLYAIATGQELHDISANLIGNGTWVKIEKLQARAGDGSLKAEGGLGFELWTPDRISMAVLLDNFPVQRESVDLAWLTGSAVLTTEIGEYKAATAVKVHNLSVRLPNANTRSLQPLDPNPDVTVTTAPVKTHPELPYVLEFIVDGRRGVGIRRDDFDASVSTELALSYAEPDLRVGGYVTFTRGRFTAFDKQFQLTRGSMLFNGTADLNPEINLVATYQPQGAGNSPVLAYVTGTLAEPHVEFTSDSCPGDGAVVLLLSGRCPTVDPSAAGDAQGAQDAFAASVVGGILTLGNTGGPRVSVESAGQSGTRVKAGIEAVPKFMRSFVQRVYLQGAVGSTQQSTTADTSTAGSGTGASTSSAMLDFLIELYFPHNLVGTGRFSPETAWGLDVTWEP